MNRETALPALKRGLPLAAASATLSAVFLVFFSSTTSFLNPWYGGDSGIFRLIGTAMAHGKSLYVDIWDHKGPALFAIEWLAQVICSGRNGIFLVQLVSLSVALFLLGLIARRFLGPVLTVVALVLFLALLSPLFEFGNLSEELSLPYTMFVLWALTRPFHDRRGEVPLPLLALSGGALAFIFFLRLNNAAGIIAAFIAYFIYVLVMRRRFWVPMLVSLAGFFLVCGLFLGYFALAGSLQEMIHATFIFNFEYAKESPSGYAKLLANGYLFVTIGLAALTVLGGLVDAQRNRRYWYVLLTAALAVVGCTAVLSSTTGYFHYLQLLVPGAAIGAILILQLFTESRVWLAAVAALALSAMLLVPFGASTAQRSVAGNEAPFAANVHAILDRVPEAERGEVFTWDLPSTYYLVADTLPVHRFFMLQEWWGNTDPIVYSELREFFAKTPPKWVVTPAKGIEQPEFSALLQAEYTPVAREGGIVLHERKP
ncbi:hypothetical protein JD292_06100 [Leucobacter sp. CSA2]|uniref:Glycosyltransferase RgtA/B/C/D-like domain-containing protein n=1 Tax=Leucobacter edaphi TaxID=2796472 RepID=A0A934QEH7_9MICO|nr:hypothetical protein [Leucobacter edaphi]MBK0421642.1 hypothetical protein [Leucobacter edaphi]